VVTKGRVEYFFRAIQSIAVLFVEFKYQIGAASERLDAIAQVIAECNGEAAFWQKFLPLLTCWDTAGDWYNQQRGVRVPVYGILCDGVVFEPFRFDGSTNPPSFNHGFYAPMTRTLLALPDLNGTTTSPFIAAFCPICEIIFDLMLRGYVSSLEVYHNRTVRNSDRGEAEEKPA